MTTALNLATRNLSGFWARVTFKFTSYCPGVHYVSVLSVKMSAFLPVKVMQLG